MRLGGRFLGSFLHNGFSSSEAIPNSYEKDLDLHVQTRGNLNEKYINSSS